MLVQIPISKKHKIELVNIEVRDPEKIKLKSGDEIKILFQEKSIKIPYNQNLIDQMESDNSNTCIVEIYKNNEIMDKASVNPLKILLYKKLWKH